MRKGNVVKWKHSHELYIVVDVDYHLEYGKTINTKIDMIPIDSSNCSVEVSRKHPFTRKVCAAMVEDREAFGCDGRCDECSEYRDIPDPQFDIDNIEYVADNIKSYFMDKFHKSIFNY